MTREETLVAFSAAKQYVRDLEDDRASAFVYGRAWTQERQDELDAAKAERGELARQATRMSIESRDA